MEKQRKFIDGSLLIKEDESKATINTKHFIANNGTEKVIVSSEALHFYDENKKKWRNIDNSLEDAEGGYSARFGKYKAKLSDGEATEKVEVVGDKNSFSWEYLGTRRPDKLDVRDHAHRKKISKAKIESRVPGKFGGASSKVVYENSDGNVDLEYIVKANSIKENILVKEKADVYKYYYALNAEGFNIKLSENNRCIELYAKDNDSADSIPEFVIPEPYMFDANGVSSNNVFYELEEYQAGLYLFSVEADAAWINARERVLPVTIDPQFVKYEMSNANKIISATSYTTTYYYQSNTYDSCGNTMATNHTTSTGIRINKNQNSETYCRINVDCSKIPLPVNERVNSAKLILTSDKTFLSNTFSISKVSGKRNDRKYEINITEYVNSRLAFSFELNPYYGCDVSFLYTGTDAPYIVIECECKDSNREKKHIIPLIDNIMGEYNLLTDEFVIGFAGVSDPVLDIGISYLHKNTDTDYHCGNNFRLNIDETLVKVTESPVGEKYVYTDSMGISHSFYERFYYIDENNEKKDIDANTDNVHVDIEGVLWYDVYSDNTVIESHKAYRELYTIGGLTASSRLEGVKHSQWFEQRTEEEKKLDEQLKAYEDIIFEAAPVSISNSWDGISTVKGFNSNNSLVEKIEKLSEENLESRIENRNSILPYSDAVALQSMILQRNGMREQLNAYDTQITSLTQSIDSLQDSITMYERQKYDVQHSNTPCNCYSYSDNGTVVNSCKETNCTCTGNSNNTCNCYRDAWTTIYAEEIENAEENKEILKEQISDIRRQKTNLEEQIDMLNTQMKLYKDKASKYSETIRTYYKEYLKVVSQREILKKQLPIAYLTSDKYIKGFNEDGELVVIYDKYGNYNAIEREEYTSSGKSRVSSIVNQDNCKITFEYDTNNKIARITNSIGKYVNYTYNGGELNTIEYSDGKRYSIEYTSDKITAISSNIHKVDLEYAGNALKKVTLYSLIEDISNDNGTAADKIISDITCASSSCNIRYNSSLIYVTYTEFKNDRNEKIRYMFSSNDDYIGCCRLLNDHVVDYVKEEFKACSYYKKETAKPKHLNCLSFENFDFGANTVREEIKYNAFNDPIEKIVDWTEISHGTSRRTETYYTYDTNRRVIKTDTHILTKIEDNDQPKIVEITKYFYNHAGDVIRTETYIDGEEFISGVEIEENVYNDKGVKVKSFTYNSLDSTSKFYSEYDVDEKGKVLAEYDSTGEHKTAFEYEADGVTTKSSVLPNGSKFAYGRDHSGEVTAISHSTDAGESNSTEKFYTHGLLTLVKSGNNVTEYTYDAKKRVTAVKLNGVENYITYEYTEETPNLDKVVATMIDDTEYTVVKDRLGNVVESSCNISTVFNTYNKWNKIETSETSDGEILTTEFDNFGNITSVAENGVVKETYAYNSYGKISNKTVHGIAYGYAYKDTSVRELDSISVGDITAKPKLDVNGRNVGKSIEISGDIRCEELISYVKFGDHATMLPSTVRYGAGRNGTCSLKDYTKYRYDSMGNICEVLENGLTVAQYEYDMLGRLIREDNRKFARTSIYTYDNNGNILSRLEYNLTNVRTNELKLTIPREAFVYEYDGDNTDKLICYAGTEFTYDRIGNPTTYRGRTATWSNGRQLVSYDGNTYTYDARGRRISKRKDNNTAINFTYDSNGNLVSQSNGMEFLYDHTGVFAVIFNGTTYFYRKNVQGDIIAILDNAGRVVVKYTYDAWGNTVTEVLDCNANAIAELNPFRYRGYYYDIETELYFLKSRYYDPELGRFMTIDDVSYLDPDTINGLNIYAYCGNNPVANVDYNGNEWWNPFSWTEDARRFVGGLIIAAVGIATIAVSISSGGWACLLPGYGTILTVGISTTMFGAFTMASTWDPLIKQDMEAINFNPFNTNSNMSNVNKVSFYKGVPVVVQDFASSSFSAGAIFLKSNQKNWQYIAEHEWGHWAQLLMVGPLPYLTFIAFPSVYYNKFGDYISVINYDKKLANKMYYSKFWERTADWLGGANRNNYFNFWHKENFIFW